MIWIVCIFDKQSDDRFAQISHKHPMPTASTNVAVCEVGVVSAAFALSHSIGVLIATALGGDLAFAHRMGAWHGGCIAFVGKSEGKCTRSGFRSRWWIV
jgi:hypothetical protein